VSRIRTVLFGLGAIGAGIGRLALERDEIEIVGAVDADPAKAGASLFDLLELPGNGRQPVAVASDPVTLLAQAKPQLVLHATGSYLPDVLPQLLACAQTGANVVSTCEELAYPWRRHPELAKQLDAEAKANGVTVLGTGVNPGFMMDTLVATLSGVCQSVESVRIARVVDVAKRRVQLQRKVGVGLTVDEFNERVASGRFGHVGLPESCWLVAEALGWRLDSLEERIEPVIGSDGQVTGHHQTATGTLGGRTLIEAVVHMSAGAERPRDEIVIHGTPPVHMEITPGIQGDSATAAVVLNASRHVVQAAPGLVTMLDLPALGCRGALS
jgi:4-hydroxy-tetrahydrodipicolinate reductase